MRAGLFVCLGALMCPDVPTVPAIWGKTPHQLLHEKRVQTMLGGIHSQALSPRSRERGEGTFAEHTLCAGIRLYTPYEPDVEYV